MALVPLILIFRLIGLVCCINCRFLLPDRLRSWSPNVGHTDWKLFNVLEGKYNLPKASVFPQMRANPFVKPLAFHRCRFSLYALYGPRQAFSFVPIQADLDCFLTRCELHMVAITLPRHPQHGPVRLLGHIQLYPGRSRMGHCENANGAVH